MCGCTARAVYSVVKDKAAAKKNFAAVFTQFPKSEKAATAMCYI
jgi:TolA-binding protein